MGMFLNYQDISNNYTPNNLICSFPVGKSYTKLDPYASSKPYEEYDVHGNLIGYFWHYGETLNLEFNIDGEITVEDDSIIYYAHNQAPTETTVGKVNQRAYNVVDYKSWTCISINDTDSLYIWKQDADFTYDELSNNSIYVDASSFLQNKEAKLSLYNFRMETVYSKVVPAKSKIIFEIDRELSMKLHKGIYYCSLSIMDDTMLMPIFSSHDCMLSVK